MITLTPLTPPPSASTTVPLADQPVCYLLQVDDVKVLLDVGGYDPRTSSRAQSYEFEEKIRSYVFPFLLSRCLRGDTYSEHTD